MNRANQLKKLSAVIASANQRLFDIGPPRDEGHFLENIEVVGLVVPELMTLWRVFRPWAEEIFGKFILNSSAEESHVERLMRLSDSQSTASTVGLPALHMVEILSSQPSICSEIALHTSFYATCIHVWLLVVPHRPFRQSSFIIVSSLSDADPIRLLELARDIAPKIPFSVVESAIDEFPRGLLPVAKRGSSYVRELHAMLGSLLYIVTAAPDNCVFYSPICMRWFASVLKQLVKEQILASMDYEVITEILHRGLLEDVETAASIVAKGSLSLNRKLQFNQALISLFASLEGVGVVRSMLDPDGSLDTPDLLLRLRDRARWYGDAYDSWRDSLICQYPSCSFNKTGIIGVCMDCGDKFYCSKACQSGDWKEHRAKCKKATRTNRLGGFYVKNAAHRSFFTHIVACEVADLSADPNGTKQDLRTLAQKENVPERHIITVLDYRSGCKQLYRPMEAGERSWNTTDTFMVEVMTLGLKKNLHWQRSMRLDG
ncbi:hypothetical protein EV421DRAFT_1904049 [Armillaria borealis]|uniref:MYND-type domain-containing protein n=1 Tax=Armillaria borealis TaxID=47425 RepID=A0AA39MQK6_9AGAR|nr:hypothetical protein EV421DRAFT_1904049 [Armillaria borealis]